MPKKSRRKRSPNKSGSHSKQKGAAFERTIAQRLSLWISNGRSKDLLWRSAMSGGRYTVSRKSEGLNAENSVGDLSAKHPDGFLLLEYFSVECKFYSDLSMAQPIFGALGRMPIIWYQPFEEARSAGKEPFVVAKQNRQDPLLLTTRKGYEILNGGTTKKRGRIRIRAVIPTNPKYKPPRGTAMPEPAYVLSFNEVVLLSKFKRLWRKVITR